MNQTRIVLHVNLHFRKYFQRTTMYSNSKQQGQRSQRAGQSRVRVPVGAKILFSSSNLSDRLWDPLGPLLNGYRRYFPRVKRLDREADLLHPGLTLKNLCCCIYNPPTILHDVDRITFHFTFRAVKSHRHLGSSFGTPTNGTHFRAHSQDFEKRL